MRPNTEYAFYALFVLTAACILILCSIPRALAPSETPTLLLDRAKTAAVVSADRAARAPDTEAARELDKLFLEFGALENHTLEKGPTPKVLAQLLAAAYEKVKRESGEPGVLAVRSAAVERLEAALALRLPDAETERVLGLFPEALGKYAVTRNGFEIAPHFVMRTLYKSRWNLAMGLEAEFKFQPVENEAYYGWLALHSSNLSPGARMLALQRYSAAGGGQIAEARGVLAFMSHDFKQAADVLDQAYRESSSLRIRNWQRGAQVAANAVDGE